jgi:hypothetical protein
LAMGANNSKPKGPSPRQIWNRGMIELDAFVSNVAKLNQALNSVHDATDAVKRALPKVHITASQAVYMASFSAFVSVAAVAVQFVQVYQGQQLIAELRKIREELVAHTGLDAPEKFAKQVYKYIDMKVSGTKDSRKEHFYFVYHPDNDWHPTFFTMVKSRPLTESFYGMSENLDALCVWMQFVRMMFAKMRKAKDQPVFHILIPGYRPFAIPEPLAFPEALQPLCIHGLINNCRPYVQLNLPGAEEDMLDGVELWKKRHSWLGVFEKDKVPRVLGCISKDVDESVCVTKDIRKVYRRKRRTQSH